MTYVSRKTRIIISRWSDECDAEYTLRACRKRSDGRLKRHASCDDIRAWISDNCVRHELLVDLMSDGEFLGKPPFRLYGRFIPVPILFKLTQKTIVSGKDESKESLRNSGSGARQCRCCGGTKTNSARRMNSMCAQVNLSASDSRNRDSELESKGSFSTLEWEKSLLEKRLCECTCLLNMAVGQLEKIDHIVGFAPDETEILRNEQIHSAFQKSKEICACPLRNNNPPNLTPSRSYVRKLKESTRYAELMRKISGLREKLKKIQECRQEISQQIRISKIRAENCASTHQVTELYSRREQAHMKRLQKKLEKLITERGRLLSEMCQTLACLNSIKKTSRSSMSFSRRRSKTGSNSEILHNEKPANFSCCCTCSEYNESTDSEQVRCSESSSGESGINRGCVKGRNMNLDLKNGLEARDIQANCAGEFLDDESFDSERCSGDDNSRTYAENKDRNPRSPEFSRTTAHQKMTKDQTIEGGNYSSAEKQVSKAGKSFVKFNCQEPPCKRKLYADDLSAYEDSLSPAQQALILEAIKNIQNPRPTTSPTTKRERDAVALQQSGLRGHSSDLTPNRECFPERQIKSETTMKDIEKTLRNYEERLNQLGSLECRIEELRQKSSEADRLKRCLERMKKDMEWQKAMEREKSNREMTKLCSENWELKKQVQQLTVRFEAQCKKIQNLKCGMTKARELECEAEELKKELSEYRDSFEHQRKCISKWESVVAVQRTEIENLRNHLRKLTTVKETASNAHQTKKSTQRSRSYSPDVKAKRMTSGGKPPKNYGLSSEEEDASFCCRECLQGENRRRSHLRSFDRGCCPPTTRGMQWCN